MLNKLTLLLALLLFSFSCKKEIQSKPNIVKLEYKSSKDQFLKSIEFADSATIYMKYESKKNIISNSSVNKLAMNLYFDNIEEKKKQPLNKYYDELKKKVEAEILNHKEYDVLYVAFYNGFTKYSEMEETFN